ncbi:MAG: hypothetical protein ABI678_16415 [Kofleriaceae bacterium]
MTRYILLASLLLPALAHADKKPALLIEETHKGLGIDVGDAGFQVFDDGSYHVYQHDPKAMRSLDRKGALTAKELADIKAALAKVPWKVTHNAVTCDALSTAHTVWSAGKHTFDAVLCGTESIDDATQKLFGFVDGLETKYAAKK